jgi:23S rRNA U2552 (ribose-2'-O)-methylase RlmE/FtsJ
MNFFLENNISGSGISFDLNNIDIAIIKKNKNILFKKYYDIVSKEKEKIDKLENGDNWDKMKKIGNPYELIYTTYNKKRKNDSISQYIPISRSYFKMWEIFYKFDIFKHFNLEDEHIFGHLAEGPGGFMEASYNYKYKMTEKINNNDIFHGITLKATNNYIPDFSKIKKLFNEKSNIRVDYGNLYMINDVVSYLNNFVSKKAIFVTADGGFDYSSNFNGQEINSCQIIYSECIIALNILETHGSFVCKVFDLFSFTMIQILYIVSLSFEKVYIYKPETSRPANSEKYLVCLYYKNNLTKDIKMHLLNLIEKWQNLTTTISSDDSIIFKNLKINNLFIQRLNEYNENYMETQIFYLNNTIQLAQNKLEKEKYYEIIQKQVNNAIDWCKKYDIEINTNSIYYKKNYLS